MWSTRVLGRVGTDRLLRGLWKAWVDVQIRNRRKDANKGDWDQSRQTKRLLEERRRCVTRKHRTIYLSLLSRIIGCLELVVQLHPPMAGGEAGSRLKDLSTAPPQSTAIPLSLTRSTRVPGKLPLKTVRKREYLCHLFMQDYYPPP